MCDSLLLAADPNARDYSGAKALHLLANVCFVPAAMTPTGNHCTTRAANLLPRLSHRWSMWRRQRWWSCSLKPWSLPHLNRSGLVVRRDSA